MFFFFWRCVVSNRPFSHPVLGGNKGFYEVSFIQERKKKPEWVGKQEKAQEAEGNEQQMFHTQEGKQHL